MPASAIVNIIRWLALCGLLMIHAPVMAQHFTIDEARIQTIGNGHVLNARIHYPLTPRVKEAIANGIPVTFYQQFRLIKSIPILGKYWQWDQELWRTEIRYTLRFHALSRQYLLVDRDTRHQRNFTTLTDALAAMGEIRRMSLPPEFFRKPQHLKLQIRTGIDVNALPTPMRPGALVSSKWQLTSPWVTAQWD